MGEAYIVGRNRVSRVQWHKWNCIVDTTYEYVETDKGVGDTYGGDGHYSVGFMLTVYEDYEFSSDSGFYGVDSIGRVLATEAVGYYQVQDTDVFSIDNVEETVRNGEDVWLIYKTRVAAAYDYSDTDYDKGSTDYGLMYASKGKLPEEGECIIGSATGSYCVLKIDGKHYYYEKVET